MATLGGNQVLNQGDLGPVQGNDGTRVTRGPEGRGASPQQPEAGEQECGESTEEGGIHERWAATAGQPLKR
jgi:hypothetical protein